MAFSSPVVNPNDHGRRVPQRSGPSCMAAVSLSACRVTKQSVKKGTTTAPPLPVSLTPRLLESPRLLTSCSPLVLTSRDHVEVSQWQILAVKNSRGHFFAVGSLAGPRKYWRNDTSVDTQVPKRRQTSLPSSLPPTARHCLSESGVHGRHRVGGLRETELLPSKDTGSFLQ